MDLNKQRAFFGIEYQEVDNDSVIVSQRELKTSKILTQKELIARGKEAFPDKRIIPNVYSLDTSSIDVDWITSRMELNGLKASDLVRHLAFEKGELSKILNGSGALSKKSKAAFFFYFRTYDLLRQFEDYMEVKK